MTSNVAQQNIIQNPQKTFSLDSGQARRNSETKNRNNKTQRMTAALQRGYSVHTVRH